MFISTFKDLFGNLEVKIQKKEKLLFDFAKFITLLKQLDRQKIFHRVKNIKIKFCLLL